MEWISVEDRLPEPPVRVFTWGAFDIPWPCYFTSESKWRDATDGEWLVGITHWMPLPEPPKTTP